MSYTLDKLKFITRVPNGFQIYCFAHSKSIWKITRWIACFYRKLIIFHVRVVSVIGSLGKTTTTRALQAVLLTRKPKQSFGNARNAIAENLIRVSPRDKRAVLEVAIGGVGQMGVNSWVVRPNVVVVTSVKSEHNRSFKTLDVTRREKGIMVKDLGPDGLAVLNGDDANVMWMAQGAKARVITYGFQDGNDVRAADFELDWPHGSRFKIIVGQETREIRVKLLGDINAYPILAAVAVGLEEGFTLDDMIPKLERLPPREGRLEIVPLAHNVTLIDDSFKGTEESCYAAMDIMEKIPGSRRIYLMGNVQEPSGKQGPVYKAFGQRAAQCVDKVFFCGGTFQRVRSGLILGGMDRESIVECGSRWEKAFEAVRAEIRDGDVVLVKGRADQELRRASLALRGKDVQCSVKSCKIPVDKCDDCPFLYSESSAFDNQYVQEFIRIN